MSKEREESIIDHPFINHSRTKREVLIDSRKEIQQLKSKLEQKDKKIKELGEKIRKAKSAL
jgi:hypothetical protein